MTQVRFQSTRPTRGATRNATRFASLIAVSIHAPHEGRDNASRAASIPSGSFNPRAPRGARRHGDTLCEHGLLVSIHAPHEGRDLESVLGSGPRIVSIHAPHEGRDVIRLPVKRRSRVSIHAPHEGRDLREDARVLGDRVSIHAPHEGRDSVRSTVIPIGRRFNPRAPRGARPMPRRKGRSYLPFQSTRPTRGATTLADGIARVDAVSIHAPHEGRDCLRLSY